MFVLVPFFSMAQMMQIVKGKVTDKETHLPVVNAVIQLNDAQDVRGTVTDMNGEFMIDNVIVGKRNFTISFTGYNTVVLRDIDVTTGKEVVLTVEMEENVRKMEEVVITSKRDHQNDMAIVSTKTFDVHETNRYAGSRSDPARMASNFAGVQGGDDSRNDIIIRGNSPQGVLWRVEGIDIPNPNHFSIPGTSGGPVSMLNNKTLANSDFFMSAFPADYGNAVGGVFDVRLRNGNNDKFEFSGQLGFLGTELAAEGPISRANGSSFLVTYRYSTLDLFNGLHINIGTSSVPKYQDATFKLNFPFGKKGEFSIFGIGGLSSIDLVMSKVTGQSQELYGESDRDQYFTSNTGVLGASLGYSLTKKTYMKFTVGVSGNNIFANHNYINRDSTTGEVQGLKPILGYDFKTTTANMHWYVNKKVSPKHNFRLGVIANTYLVDFIDSSRQYPVTQTVWQRRENYSGNTSLIQGYLQYKYRPRDNMTITAGVHAQTLSHNNAFSIEPRVGYRWALTANDFITAGYGLHSQIQPLYQYFAQEPFSTPSYMQNYNVGFTKSHHGVIGYDRIVTERLRMKLEGYYQYLFNVPVETRAGSSYSALDQGTGYSRYFPDTLKNTGTGINYGVELTLDKAFYHGFYYMANASVYSSKAAGNDGVYRSTDYDTKYAVNILAGYEKKVSDKAILILGGKVTMIGGKLYSPVDTARSLAYGDAIVIDSLRNTLRFKDYFRADLKLGFRINAKKMSHEVGIDLVNVLNTKNVLSVTYSQGLAAQKGNTNPFFYQYQLGFLPLFYYRADISLKKKDKNYYEGKKEKHFVPEKD